MVKDTRVGVSQLWVRMLALLLTRPTSDLVPFLKTQFSPLQNGTNKNPQCCGDSIRQREIAQHNVQYNECAIIVAET